MSGPLPCDNHADRLALVLMTNLQDGSTATLCDECTVQWAAMLIQGLEFGPAPEAADDLEDEGVAPPEPAQAAPDAGSKSLPEAETTEEPEPEPPPGPAPEAEAASH